MNTEEAIRTRKSVRRFQDRPVPRKVVEGLLDIARWAPSGGNCQPWRVDVAAGRAKKEITEAILSARRQGAEECPEFEYYPESWINPYRERRFQCGIALYSAMEIERGDAEARRQAWLENYRFFGAPVGLFFSMPRALGKGFLMDMGIFIQTLALAAVEAGLATCIQASLAGYPRIVKKCLEIPDDFILVCGMSMGYEDRDARVNNFRTTRAPLEEFVSWHQ